jgi:hypothetical protein
MDISMDEESLLNKSKEELVDIIKTIYNKLLEKPKISEAQLKAIRNYNKNHPEILAKSKKQYYEKKKLDPIWLAEQNRLNKERYHRKKILAQNTIN